MDWQDGLDVCKLASEIFILGLNYDTAINSHPGISLAERCINVCAGIGRTLSRRDCLNAALMVVGGHWRSPTTSFVKSRWVITSTMNKYYKFLPSSVKRQVWSAVNVKHLGKGSPGRPHKVSLGAVEEVIVVVLPYIHAFKFSLFLVSPFIFMSPSCTHRSCMHRNSTKFIISNGVMFVVSALSLGGRWFEPRPSHPKDFKMARAASLLDIQQ